MAIDENSTNKRIAHLEAQFTGVSTRLDGLEHSVEHLASSITKLTDVVTSRGTDWKALASWASVILAISIAIGSLSIQPLHQRIVELVQWQEDTIKDRWTKTDQNRFEDKFDVILQREMRLLDEILQREMKLADGIIEEKVKAVEILVRNKDCK